MIGFFKPFFLHSNFGLKNHRFFLGLFFITCFSSCGKAYQKKASVKSFLIPLSIAMPQNKHVLFNISPLIYSALYQQFEKVGYQLQSSVGSGYLLKTEILEFEGAEKFISPDFLTYGSRLKLVILVQLFSTDGTFLVEKIITESAVFLRPKKSVFNSSYLEFTTERMLRMVALRIEQQLRPYMMPQSV